MFVATYPTMMSLIEERDGSGRRRFGVGHFDLVIVDEAHRSIYRKYGAIFDWFDSLLVGLTATPKDEIDRNTYGLSGLENGMPTDAYGLEEAVRDEFLVPMRAVSVPLKFQREGIRYDDLSEEDREEWDALEWSEEGSPPDRVEAQAVNKWLFNADTVDKVLAHLMTRGQHVEGGDRLGKTIIFAKNHAHAEFIRERFDANYPHLKGTFARVIDFKVDYAQSLIDSFSIASKPPHIAISVDMLDTGIDVPEVVNLVFFKLVRSRTKFWQMIGRGTRLCPDLFGPGQDKAFFTVFDFCQNLEFFSQEAGTDEGSVGDSLSARLFKTRLDLIGVLDERLRDGGPDMDAGLRGEVVSLLRGEVAAMNVNNFLVQPAAAPGGNLRRPGCLGGAGQGCPRAPGHGAGWSAERAAARGAGSQAVRPAAAEPAALRVGRRHRLHQAQGTRRRDRCGAGGAGQHPGDRGADATHPGGADGWLVAERDGRFAGRRAQAAAQPGAPDRETEPQADLHGFRGRHR